ncbi:MAG: response regulator [Leptolyngbyaceae cyanobacterium MO_188.B28]|nr:response regulator [Leptolyngbyaceae cyanobacterium MO_188.B28]
MSISDANPQEGADAIAEALLQQELSSLFALDTQNYLQQYSQIAQQLQASSWKINIQELYRCIHTIKGGAVTVAAEAVLLVATALEDLLSDLRYLDPAPPLEDGELSQALLEAGELLTGTLEHQGSQDQTMDQIEPILARIHTLHEQIQRRYLPQWNEQKQLHQEFAEQGLDLVVLDLEIALEQLPDQRPIIEPTIKVAQQTLAQLQQVGQDLKFAAGWNALLERGQELLTRPELAIWRSHWPQLFHALKNCAKKSGEPVVFEFTQSDAPPVIDQPSSPIEASDIFSAWGEPNINSVQADAFLADGAHPEDLADVNLFLDDLSSLEDLAVPEVEDQSDRLTPDEELANFNEVGDFLNDLGILEEESELDPSLPPEISTLNNGPVNFEDLGEFFNQPSQVDDWLTPTDADSFSEPASQPDDLPNLSQVQELLEQSSRPDNFPEPLTQVQIQKPGVDQPKTLQPAAALVNAFSSKPGRPSESPENVKIPVALEKLDQSAQYLVETLLTARATQGFSQILHNQIAQLVALAQESAQHLTHLRQIQDDYALLDTLRNTTRGPTPERYREGYTTINRLLETSLRLSELGAEAEKTSRHAIESLQDLDSGILKLQNTVEESRLVPFQNLGFRVRAILRDLTTRYDKPAQLSVQGERIELDVGTARSLEPVLLHLVRNAYDHGLETPSERIAQGKPEQGSITLSLQRHGDSFLLDLMDDGRGIDAKAIQARAESLGLPRTNVQTSAELLAVICQPGFSASTQVSEISGRGVGMDVVAAQVAQLGGRLGLTTIPGKGTTFHLQFSVPHLLVSCLLLQAGDLTFAIPTEDIKTTALLDSLNSAQTKDPRYLYSWTVQDETGKTPALDLLEYWQSRSAPRPLEETAICVYINSPEGANGIWLIADELLGQSELLINPLPNPLTPPIGLMGMSLQTSGDLIPVLDAANLAKRLLNDPYKDPTELINDPSEPEIQAADRLAQTILIVDDAALMRRRIEASLTAYGHTTHTCADGREAWGWLQENPNPRLIITDIEMPHMDGFTLIDRCRQAGMTAPILVISSRLSEEWFDEAKRLGANDYLTKGFSTLELIKTVTSLVSPAVSV